MSVGEPPFDIWANKFPWGSSLVLVTHTVPSKCKLSSELRNLFFRQSLCLKIVMDNTAVVISVIREKGHDPFTV